MKAVKIYRKSIVVLCGVAGCGKSTFAAKNFRPTEIVSSDRCRAMVSDDEGNMAVSREAFDIFYMIIEKRMKSGRLVVADSTALSHEARKKLLQLARHFDYHTILIAFDVPIDVTLMRNRERERNVPEKVIKKQFDAFKKSLKHIYDEGFDDIVVLKDEEMDGFNAEISDLPLKPDKEMPKDRNKHGDDERIYSKPLYLKLRYGGKVKIEFDEVQKTIDILKGIHGNLSRIVYIPPVIPSINSGSIEQQALCISRYYYSMGAKRLIIEQRDMDRETVFIVCRDSETFSRRFQSDGVGYMYSPYGRISIDRNLKDDIIRSIQSDLISSGYFEDNNIDFIIFEGILTNNNMIMPFKICCDSRDSMYSRDSIWQFENTGKLCGYSKMFEINRTVIVENTEDMPHALSKLQSEGYNEFVIKHVKAFPEYHGEAVQPEILCSSRHVLSGEGYFYLSILSHELCLAALDRFVDNKSSKRQFEYMLGSMAVNNRILNIGV